MRSDLIKALVGMRDDGEILTFNVFTIFTYDLNGYKRNLKKDQKLGTSMR